MIHLDKLIAIASPSFNLERPIPLDSSRLAAFPDLQEVLRIRDGFTAFESALVVFPTVEVAGLPSIFEWNFVNGWRKYYQDVIDSACFCFAHDLFGIQFAISSDGVVRFDPESGRATSYADSIDKWAMKLLENFEEDTAWPLAHEWQTLHRSLQPNERLLPKQPFVLGGDYVVENLVAVDCKSAMNYWGKLYNEIRNVPDGESISISGWLS